MKLNLNTSALYSDSGIFLKTMHCPKQVSWETMSGEQGKQSRQCLACDNTVYDTSLMSESEIIALFANNPNACVKVSLNQDNLYLEGRKKSKFRVRI